jgi:rod shape-determining protein MreB
VALRSDTNRVVAVGDDAKRMLGRTSEKVVAIRPMKDGVISDWEVAEAMLKHFLERVKTRRTIGGPRLVIGVPCVITGMERKAVVESALLAGARQVFLIGEPMAVAIAEGAAGNDVAAKMIVDIGGGTTEVAVISLCEFVYSQSLRVAGGHLDEAILQYLKQAHRLVVGQSTAEAIKMQLGSAYPQATESSMEVRGRDLTAGLPKMVTVTTQEIREALMPTLKSIIEAIHDALRNCSGEICGDLMKGGILLTGGCALLAGLDRLIAEQTGLPVHVAQDPLSSVVEGAGKALGNLAEMRKLEGCS